MQIRSAKSFKISSHSLLHSRPSRFLFDTLLECIYVWMLYIVQMPLKRLRLRWRCIYENIPKQYVVLLIYEIGIGYAHQHLVYAWALISLLASSSSSSVVFAVTIFNSPCICLSYFFSLLFWHALFAGLSEFGFFFFAHPCNAMGMAYI